jgi:uncharacterized protein with HEPN domain
VTPGYKTQIADILKATARIEEKTKGLSRETFLRDRAAVSAVEEALSRIGKAVGVLPEKVRRRYPEIDWAAWPGIGSPGRDTLWELVAQRVPDFGKQVNRIFFDITD